LAEFGRIVGTDDIELDFQQTLALSIDQLVLALGKKETAELLKAVENEQEKV